MFMTILLCVTIAALLLTIQELSRARAVITRFETQVDTAQTLMAELLDDEPPSLFVERDLPSTIEDHHQHCAHHPV